MKTTIKLEEIGKLVFSYFMTIHLGFSWWVFFAWLLAPDISFIAYLVNTRVGAVFYNLFHHQGLAAILLLTGIYYQNNQLAFAGLLLFGHSSMDRILGYGLKYDDGFKHTHLGIIGAEK